MAPSVSSELLFVRNRATIQKRDPRGVPTASRQLPSLMKGVRSLRPKALAELAAVGWRLDEYAKGKWETSDPRHPTVTLLPLFKGTSPLFNSTQPLFNGTRPVSENPATAGLCGPFANSIQDSLESPTSALSAAP
ncbi:hypothetical protein FZX15_05235 [Brucella suis bv. 1]|nr:hypothetical protein FZX15_05235 [Brucella suis bv. 1]